jgi:hypothetical protein
VGEEREGEEGERERMKGMGGNQIEVSTINSTV